MGGEEAREDWEDWTYLYERPKRERAPRTSPML